MMNTALLSAMDPDILKQIEQAQQEMNALLKPYQNKIKKQYDGRWYINYYDVNHKLHKIRKKTREEVETELITLLKPKKESETKSETTLENLFPKFLKAKMATTSMGNSQRLDADWKKYLADTPLAKMDVTTVKVSELTTELAQIIKNNHMTDKQYKNTKTVVNGIFAFAVNDGIITVNTAKSLPGLARNLCESAENNQVFEEQEEERVVKTCYQCYEAEKNPSYLAVVLNFLLGIRVGELAALKYEDFDFDAHILTLQRSEKTVRAYKDGAFKTVGYKVVPELKGKKKRIEVSLDDNETEAIVSYIRSERSGEYLFEYPDGRRMTAGNVNRALATVRKKLNTPANGTRCGNHKIRKTVISRLIASGLFSIVEISKRAGHEKVSTTLEHYAYPFTSNSNAKKIGQALFIASLVQSGPADEKKEEPTNP